MQITKIGHCCVRIELDGVRIITDPGMWTREVHVHERDIDVILITHEHGDHMHIDSLKELLVHNPEARIITNADVGDILHAEGIPYECVDRGATTTIGTMTIYSHDAPHAEIYGEYGLVQNTGYRIDTVLFYPGDAYTEIDTHVQVLALPVAGPWCCIKDAINYAKCVRPSMVFPVHDGMLRYPDTAHNHCARELPAAGIEFVPLIDGQTHTFN